MRRVWGTSNLLLAYCYHLRQVHKEEREWAWLLQGKNLTVGLLRCLIISGK